jgi:PAS domain S-box-containing protein
MGSNASGRGQDRFRSDLKDRTVPRTDSGNHPAASGERGITVLLIEDNPAHAELVSRALADAQAGYNLVVVPSLHRARAYLDSSSPDLILADLALPDGQGLDILNTDQGKLDLPVVVLTAQGDEQVAVEAMKAGTLDYIVKSASAFAAIPIIVERALREWGHIVERRRAEEALLFSEQRYRQLVEDSFDGIFTQKGTTITFANKQLYEMLGYGPGELEGLDHWLLYHPDYQELTRSRARERLRGEAPPSRYEVKLQRKDGTSFDGEVGARTFMVDGEPGIQVWVRDISDRKRAEEELRKSEERHRFLSENMADIIWTLDHDFQTTYVSPSIKKALGFTPEERKRQTLAEMVTPDSIQKIMAVFQAELRRDDEAQADPDRYVSVEVEYYHRDGHTVWMENSVKALRDEDGRIVGMYGSSRDITERKAAEAERDRLIGELEEALVKVKTLRGLIPICANCKKIRDDSGFWQQVEVYMRDHSEAQFSHGLCPECLAKLYPDFVPD